MRLASFPAAREEVDDLFDRFLGGGQTLLGRSSPMLRTSGFEVPTDVFQLEDEFVIRMDLPGVDRADIEVTVQDGVLVINGSRRFPYKAEDVRFLRRGTLYGDFTQRVSLGKGLSTEDITARFEGGVLELRVPHAEEVKPRRIEVQSGELKELAG